MDISHFQRLTADRVRGGFSRVIATITEIGANREDFAQHRDGIACEPDTAIGHVIPGNRNLANSEVMAAGYRQQFDIESPARNGLLVAERDRNLARHALESALCILNSGQEQHLHQPVEDTAHHMAIPRLAVTARAVSLPRGYRDSVSLGGHHT